MKTKRGKEKRRDEERREMAEKLGREERTGAGRKWILKRKS